MNLRTTKNIKPQGSHEPLVTALSGQSDSLSCVRCGACMAVCPLYGLVGRESAVARGKLNLLSAYQDSRLISGAVLREILECCLLCGACTEKCAVGLSVPELIKDGRAQIRDQEGPEWSPALFLAYVTWQAPHLIPLAAPLVPLINRLKDRLGDRSGLMWRLFPHLWTGLSRFPQLARKPFRSQAPRTLPGRSSLRVAFFVGCGIEALYPQVGQALLSICQRLGIEVIIPLEQGCCGLMAESVGERGLARAMGKRLVQEFAALKIDYLVTACASCSYQLKRLGQVLVDTPEFEAAEQLSLRVREASEFLVQAADYQPASRPSKERVAFHDPCHLHRGQGITAEPRELLKKAIGMELTEAREKQCCGLGGAFGVLYPNLSHTLREARMQAFSEAGAEALVTSCTGCLAQLAGTTPGLQVFHLLEIIS